MTAAARQPDELTRRKRWLFASDAEAEFGWSASKFYAVARMLGYRKVRGLQLQMDRADILALLESQKGPRPIRLLAERPPPRRRSADLRRFQPGDKLRHGF